MSPFPTSRLLTTLGLLLAGALGAARADHIQSFQLPENVLGQVQFNAGGTGDPSTATNLYRPGAVAVDPTTGKVFVADTNNNRVLRYASAAALLTGASAEAAIGQPSFILSGNATTQKELFNPSGLAFDSTGRLWVADTENNRVLRFDNASAKPTFSATADGVLGQATFSASAAPNPPTAASMNQPGGLAVEANGTLWVSDRANYRILRFDNAATKLAGANADGVLGVPVFTAAGARITAQYTTSFAEGLAVDAAGTLWVADSLSHRVLRFDNAATKVNGALADGLLGQSAFDASIAYSPPTAATMASPTGVAIDASGTLWVSDAGNNRVLRFDNAASKLNGAGADVVLGQKDFVSNFPATTRAGMDRPSAIALTPSGDLFVTETENNRALRFTPKPDPAAPTPVPAPTAVAPPTVKVSGKKSLITSQTKLLVKGTASGAAGVARVEYRIGKGGLHFASGTVSWQFKAALKPGKNTITIQAVGADQQTSASAVLHITRD